MQPLAMKLLRICALLALLVSNIICCPERPADSKKIKNGFIDIYLKNNRVTLTIRKNDGAKMQNVLITKSTKIIGTEKLRLTKTENETLIYSGDLHHTTITAHPDKEVIKVSRSIEDEEGQLTDCYQIVDDTQWFSGPQVRYQHWPIQSMYYEEEPYVPTHPKNIAVAERYWLSSRGIYIFVRDEDPLFLDQNNEKDKHLCLIAKNKSPYRKRSKITLNYDIGVFSDPKSAHKNVIVDHFEIPKSYPNEEMVRHPIWSTWAKYKVNINEQAVLEFANDIKNEGFLNSQIEIDDNWETCYGSAQFDPYKFPDVANLTKTLKELGFKVTLWIHPFINENCEESYIEAKEKGYFVQNENGSVHATWWQGAEGAGAIDFTNPEAVTWWVGRLKNILELGIDSFKFDAGETSWLPQIPKLTGPKEMQPGIYTKNYTTMLAREFNDRIEVRVGWRTQGLPIFVRMIDKDTRYTWNNGLPTLITTLLQMNLNGYPFVLPDMIGGNGYVGDGFQDTVLPSKDLFIRWLQANVFMPSIQYSFVPWQYDNETIEISKKFTKLHADLADKIIMLMNKTTTTGEPINTPIWWVDPMNVQAHKIYDEFMLGEDYLVAPVIEENAVQRDIYLPAGKWKDGNKPSNTHAGPTWLRDYSAPLDTLPYFIKQ